MSEFRGFIQKIAVKTGKGKKPPYKPYTLYSIKLADEKGVEFEQWFGVGFAAPNAKEGDYVELDAEQNLAGYWDVKGLRPLKNAPAKVATSNTASSSESVSGPAISTQSSIHYQSARNSAIEVIKLLVETKSLPVSAAQTKAGEAKRYEEIMALIDKLTVRFYVDTETQRILETVTDEGADDEEEVIAPGEGSDGDEKDE
jgi:hypothetical protein